MKNFRFVILHIARLILAIVFIYAGSVKLLSPEAFFGSIQEYRLLPSDLCYILAYFLPPLEIILGVGLFLNRYAKPCAFLIIILNITFIFAIASVWIRGIDISCGCFGSSSTLTSNYFFDIFRDFVFIIFAYLFILFYPKHKENNLYT